MKTNEKINVDRYGHCVVCHKDLQIKQVIDGVVQKRFSPEYSNTEFLLNTGSKMRVCVCKTCLRENKHTDTDKIMEAVINGWDLETDMLVADKSKPIWGKQRKLDYMDKFSKLKIVCNSEGKDKDTLDKELVKNKGVK